MIISFASSKGGVGKSTTCACIAAELALQGNSVLLIDLDQNKTLARWARKAPIERLTVLPIESKEFGEFFRKQATAGNYDHICIDLPGTRETTMFKVLARSDLVVIPAQASEPDLREALVVVSDIRDVREETGRAIPYRLLLTKIFPLRSRVTDFAYGEMERLGLPLFRTTLVERSAYREMFLNGQPPTQGDAGKGAGAEVRELLAEIQVIVGGAPDEMKMAS